MLKKAFQRQEFRFLVVGASNTLWGIVSYPIYFWILNPLGVNYILVLLVTYFLNGIISFTTQKYFVFRTKGNHLKEFWKFFLLQASILAINLAALPLAVQELHLNPVVAQTIFLIVVIVSSFFFHKFVTFKHKQNKNIETPKFSKIPNQD